MQNEFGKIKAWVRSNYLTINLDKTQTVAFGCYSDSVPHLEHIVIHEPICTRAGICGCPQIENVHSVKYLGIKIDSHLRWNDHIDYVAKKLRNMPCLFYRLRRCLNETQLRMIYHALFESVLFYGIVGWGGVNDNVIKKLQVTQNHTLRVMLRKDRLYSTIQLYRDAMVLNVRQKYCAAAIHQCIKNDELINVRFLGMQSWSAENAIIILDRE